MFVRDYFAPLSKTETVIARGY